MPEDNDKVILYSQLVLGLLSTKKNVSFSELIELSNYLVLKHPNFIVYEADDDCSRICKYANIMDNSIDRRSEYQDDNEVSKLFENYAGEDVLKLIQEKKEYVPVNIKRKVRKKFIFV